MYAFSANYLNNYFSFLLVEELSYIKFIQGNAGVHFGFCFYLLNLIRVFFLVAIIIFYGIKLLENTTSISNSIKLTFFVSLTYIRNMQCLSHATYLRFQKIFKCLYSKDDIRLFFSLYGIIYTKHE